MINDWVWVAWISIFRQVINMIVSNEILSITFFVVVIDIIVNLIWRLSSPKDEG